MHTHYTHYFSAIEHITHKLHHISLNETLFPPELKIISKHIHSRKDCCNHYLEIHQAVLENVAYS